MSTSIPTLKRCLPPVDRVAFDLYGIEFRQGRARCPFTKNHSHGDRNPSLRFDTAKNRIFCASQQCFGPKGSDAIDLVRVMDGCRTAEAVRKLAKQYGVQNGHQPPRPPKSQPPQKPGTPIPAETVRAQLRRQGFEVVAEHSYGPSLRKVRFEHTQEKQADKDRPEKTFRWEYRRDDRWWKGDGGKPKPAYLNGLFRERDQLGAVLGVEGEAKADFAGQLGFPAFREKISAQDAEAFTDLDVVLWADRDKAGQKYMEDAADTILQHGQTRSLRVIQPPADLPTSGDLVDAVQMLKWDHDKIEEAISRALPYKLPAPSDVDCVPLSQPKKRTRIDGAPTAGDRSLPEIDAGNQDLKSVTTEAWDALVQSNVPPRLFRFAGLPSRIEFEDDGTPHARPLNRTRMRYESARACTWYRLVKRNEDGSQKKLVYPPMAVVEDMLASPNIPLPVLAAIIEAPTFLADGTLHTQPGYNTRGRTYYAPGAGLESLEICDRPTTKDIERAKGLLLGELLGEFPFVGDPERAHAVAALLMPFVRPLISGPTPLHLIEKPTPGTGATLLADALAWPAFGRKPRLLNEGRDDDEWRKRITAVLRKGTGAILIDNIKRPLISPNLSSALTTTRWEDRILGFSESLSLPNHAIWMATGNNPKIDLEMARRIVRIRLDAKVEQPWMRQRFRHPDLHAWMTENRSAVVSAALVLIRYWITSGRPVASSAKLGMFESWSNTMGGILQAAGIPGFLANLQEFYAASDNETEQIRAFLAAWHHKYSSREVVAADLSDLATAAGLDLGGRNEHGQVIKLGQRIKQWRDRQYTILDDFGTQVSVRVEHAGTCHRAAQWRLIEVPE